MVIQLCLLIKQAVGEISASDSMICSCMWICFFFSSLLLQMATQQNQWKTNDATFFSIRPAMITQISLWHITGSLLLLIFIFIAPQWMKNKRDYDDDTWDYYVWMWIECSLWIVNGLVLSCIQFRNKQTKLCKPLYLNIKKNKAW